jgi:hypothetical protein
MIDWALLLAALIAVESGGDVNAVGDSGKAVGCLQIHPVMVDECNRILHRKFGEQEFRFTLKDRRFESTSRNMAITYLRYWGESYQRKTGNAPTYETYARLWNGGPAGYRKAATDAYWRKVRAALDNQRQQKEAAR